jgi:mRNA interferase HigB
LCIKQFYLILTRNIKKLVVITFKKIRAYATENKSATIALLHWHNVVEKADWSCLADIKMQFPSVDYVGDNRYVFNIKGNHYRVITMIHFDIRTVYLRFIGTHAEYDKMKANEA